MNATATVVCGPQHMLALQRANQVRLARAALKRAVSRGEVDPADVVLACPWEAESMEVGELLTAQKRWGHLRSRTFLAAISISETKRIGSLTERQRNALARNLALANQRRGRRDVQLASVV